MNKTIAYSDVVSSLSHALDLVDGQAPGHALRTCYIGMAIAREWDLPVSLQSDLYYALLLKDAGCTAGPGPAARRFGARITRQLGFSAHTADAVLHVGEHWDGLGRPDRLSRLEIPALSRIVCLAEWVDRVLERGRPDAVLVMVGHRRGSWFDPELCDIVLSWKSRTDWWKRVRRIRRTSDLGGLEPEDRRRYVSESELDRVAEAFAGIIDAKSPYTAEHSRRVARIARSMWLARGGTPEEARRLYRAGLLHDLGKLGVSNRILEKPGALTARETDEIQVHPLHTRDILEHVEAFSDLAESAANHHERLDGTGYPWRLTEDELDMTARTLAVADVFEALSADRPYRCALGADQVLDMLRGKAGAGLDASLVDTLESCLHHDPTLTGGREVPAPARLFV